MAATLETLNAARVAFHDNKPVAYLVQTVGQTMANGAVTGVTFGVANFDTWGAWSSGTPSVYTVPVAGVYALAGVVLWIANATGTRDALFFRNGGNVNGSQVEISASSTSVNSLILPRVQVRCVAGDTLQIAAFQSSGGNLNTDVSGGFAPSMSVEWIRA